jgi:hypothetical protein
VKVATKRTSARTRAVWHEAGAPPGGRPARSSRQPWRVRGRVRGFGEARTK